MQGNGICYQILVTFIGAAMIEVTEILLLLHGIGI